MIITTILQKECNNGYDRQQVFPEVMIIGKWGWVCFDV